MAVESTPGAQAPSTPPGGPAPSRPARGNAGLNLLIRFLSLREGSIIVVTIIAIVYFGVSVSKFFTGSNFKNLLPYFCFLAIMAAGEVFVMTLGEIDLSIGALYLFIPFVYVKLANAGIPLIPSIILSLLIALVIGGINGFFITYIGVASFTATLAMLFFLDGLTLIISHSEELTTPGTSVVGVHTFAQIFGAGTYSELIWAVGIVVVLQIVLTFTRSGLYTVATGGNKLGSAEAGINVNFVYLRNFMLSSLTAGFAGILEAVRTSSVSPDPSGSNENLLLAIAAVIIGGTLMSGGSGTVIGALIGAVFLGVLNDGLVLKGTSATKEDLFLGIAIIIAMVLNTYIQRVRRGQGRG